MRKIIVIFSVLIASFSFSQATVVDFNLMNSSSEDTVVNVLKFYISSVSLTFEGDTSFYEEASYHLIDLEDTSTYSFTINHAINNRIKAITFNIGTDSIINVSGALDGDLDPIKGMYWAWNSGYINFKIEGNINTQDFEYHIGGYMRPFPTVRSLTLFPKKEMLDTINIDVNTNNFLSELEVKTLSSVLIPGTEASALADQLISIFSINE